MEIRENAPLVGQMRLVIYYNAGTRLESWTGEKYLELKVLSKTESYFDPMARPGRAIVDVRVGAIGPLFVGEPNL